jgi:hypothetical protein
MEMFFNSALEYAIRKVQENQVGLVLNGTHQLFVYADINLLGISKNIIKENTDILLEARRDDGLEVNAEKTKYNDHILLFKLRTESEYKNR